MKRALLALATGNVLAAGAARAGPAPGGADTGGDGIENASDNCTLIPGGGADTDGDGVENAFDNCTTVSNPSQTDSDHNGCGDACTSPITCDIAGDMNLVVCASDQAIIGTNWAMAVPPGTMGDCDGNGVVGASDVATYFRESLNMVGPSGIRTAACDPSTCLCTPP